MYICTKCWHLNCDCEHNKKEIDNEIADIIVLLNLKGYRTNNQRSSYGYSFELFIEFSEPVKQDCPLEFKWTYNTKCLRYNGKRIKSKEEAIEIWNRLKEWALQLPVKNNDFNVSTYESICKEIEIRKSEKKRYPVYWIINPNSDIKLNREQLSYSSTVWSGNKPFVVSNLLELDQNHLLEQLHCNLIQSPSTQKLHLFNNVYEFVDLDNNFEIGTIYYDQINREYYKKKSLLSCLKLLYKTLNQKVGLENIALTNGDILVFFLKDLRIKYKTENDTLILTSDQNVLEEMDELVENHYYIYIGDTLFVKGKLDE